MNAHIKSRNRKKTPLIAVMASLFVPGLGQIFNGELRKGLGFIMIAIIFVLSLLLLINEPHMEGPVIAAAGACVLLWIGNLYDAYKNA